MYGMPYDPAVSGESISETNLNNFLKENLVVENGTALVRLLMCVIWDK